MTLGCTRQTSGRAPRQIMIAPRGPTELLPTGAPSRSAPKSGFSGGSSRYGARNAHTTMFRQQSWVAYGR